MGLAKIRSAARDRLNLEEKDQKRLFEGNALLRRLVRIGDIDQTKMKLDFVLWLKIRGFLGASSPDPGIAFFLLLTALYSIFAMLYAPHVPTEYTSCSDHSCTFFLGQFSVQTRILQCRTVLIFNYIDV